MRAAALVYSLRAGRLLLLVGSCALAFSAVAQAPAAPAPPTPPEPPPVVETFSTAEIGVEAEKAKARLADFDEQLVPDEFEAKLREELPELTKSVEALLKESAETRTANPTLTQLDEEMLRLETLSSRLVRMQETLAEQANSVEEKLGGLLKSRGKWKATREAAVEGNAPKAAFELITEVDRTISQVEKRGRKRQGKLVELQGRVASMSESLSAERERVKSLTESLAGQILHADRQPLWKPEVWSTLESEHILERIREEQTREADLAGKYYQANRGILTLHAIGLAVLFVAMLAVRRRAERSAIADDGLANVQAVFERPLSLAVLMIFLLSVLTLPEFPRGLGQLIGVFLLVPAVLILRKLLEPPAFPILNAMLVFFVVDRARQLLVLLPDAARILFSLEMTALVGLLCWWMRPARMSALPAEIAHGAVFRAIAIGVRAAIVGGAVAAVCSVLGYTTLGYLIGANVLYAGYTAVVLYGGARVLDGLTAFLLRIRPLRLSRLVRRNRAALHQHVVWGIHVVFWFWWIQVTLSRLGIFEDVVAAGVAVLGATLSLGDLQIELGNVLVFALTVWASFAISRFVRFVLEEDIYPSLKLAKGQPYAISALTHYSILLIGFFTAISALGVDTNRFAILAGALGVGIGFGLQNIVNNFVSGLILLTERPVEVGDTVTIGDTFGLIQRIGIRSSTVRTWQGAEVIVPNANLVSEEVTNWTHTDTRRRMEIPVGVPYGTDPAAVIEILRAVVTDAEDVLGEPEPSVLFMEYGDSSLNFEVRAWTSNFDRFLGIRSDLMVAVIAALTENGIEIPFPQRDLHVRSLPPALGPGKAHDEGSET